ncbi:ZapG family protein [Paraglaciecola hydrolytica]|uniref:Uncharacterized protein n=1 Tax=Paraglaciecola hydrolytica TaxID=1799789 RepID=A0A136A1V7_9ALTE|nr:DUF1043 family protein [Paraglaciecola hydrolytica]KXI29211.1 hypothetical protein AX660_13780 [Paraglaciecola hydrolytica]
MDWLIGILLLIVGGIIGYFVAKFVNERSLLASKDAKKEQTFKEIMTQQAADHIQASKQLVQNLAQQTDALNQQIAAYEQLTTSMNANENADSLNYFGEHATSYLRSNVAPQTKEKATTEFQPLDFASQSSGLFSGAEDKKIKNAKQ